MANTVAAARAGGANRATNGLVGNSGRRILTAGFLAACGGLLAMIALRGYTIYG